MHAPGMSPGGPSFAHRLHPRTLPRACPGQRGGCCQAPALSLLPHVGLAGLAALPLPAVADYLLLKVFGFPYEVNQADGKVSAVVPPGFFRAGSGPGGSGGGAAAGGADDDSFKLVTVWRENVSQPGGEAGRHGDRAVHVAPPASCPGTCARMPGTHSVPSSPNSLLPGPRAALCMPAMLWGAPQAPPLPPGAGLSLLP